MFYSVFFRCMKYLIPGADDSNIPCSCTSNFDTLPYDVVGSIFGKLPIGDRVRMRLVSKSWRDRLVRSDFAVKPEPPWLILPIDYDSYDHPKHLSSELSFESMSEERTYHFYLPNYGPYQWCCCGSSSDGSWLLMAGRRAADGDDDDDLSSTTMMLWDPVSGTTKRLPALSTLPFFRELVETCANIGLDNISTSGVVARAQVFPVGPTVAVAIVFATKPDLVMEHHDRLALCSPEDQSWSVVPPYGPDGDFYTDVLFHNGKLFTASPKMVKVPPTSKTSSSGSSSKWAGPPVVRRRDDDCTVRLNCCDVEVTKLDIVHEYQHDDDNDQVDARKLVERWFVVDHLVGRSNGGLLVVSAILDCYSYKSGGRGPFPSHTCFLTSGFEVYGLDVNLNRLERLSMGKQSCIFVGGMGSTSVESGGIDFRIHFATNDGGVGRFINEEQYDADDDDDDDDEQDHHIQEEEGAAAAAAGVDNDALVDEEHNVVECGLEEFLVVHEQGVFDVARDKFERMNWTHLSKQSGSCVGWFTPKLPTY